MVYIAILNNSCYPVLQWILGCKKNSTTHLLKGQCLIFISGLASSEPSWWFKHGSQFRNLSFPFLFLKFEKKKEKKRTEKFALYIWPAPRGLRFLSAELHLWQDVLLWAWEHSRITKPPHRFSFFFFFSFLSSKLKLNQGSNHLSRGQYAATFISAP